MRISVFWAAIGLFAGAGCAKSLPGEETSARDNAAEETVGQVESELNSCLVLGRSTILNGVVEKLSCDGVACSRTCSSANPMLCSTRCLGNTFPPAQPFTDLSILRAECQMDQNSRVNAGWPGITKATCEGLGACWDTRTRDPNVPWCYEPLGKQPTCGSMSPYARINAGYPGIKAEVCIRNNGGCWDDRIPGVPWCFFPGPSLTFIDMNVDAAGGAITLPDFASASFPSGAFGSSIRVRLEGTRRPNTDATWQVSAAIFGATNRTPNEVRITAATMPAAPVAVTIKVPTGYQVAPDTTLSAFAEVTTGSDLDLQDIFEPLDSTYSEQDRTVRVTLPVEAFSDVRAQQPEAVLLLAGLPSVPSPANATPMSLVVESPMDSPVGEPVANEWVMSAAGADTCPAPELGSPLDGDLVVTGRYKVDNLGPNERKHKGTDFKGDGVPVYAMADGTVEIIGVDNQALAKPDVRTGLLSIGFGQFIVIAHDAKPARTLYGHLRADGVRVTTGQRVLRGQLIGISGATGAVTGPHLHVEYIPGGPFSKPAKRLDPNVCVNPNLPPSPGARRPPSPDDPPPTRTLEIEFGDNGPAKDDSFRMTLNNQFCDTLPGDTRICRFTGVRSGTTRLDVVCTSASDGVGTLGLRIITPGVVFGATGTSFLTGTLRPDGRSALIPVIIVP